MMEYFQQCPDLFLVAGAGPVLAGYIVSCRRAAFTELVSIAVAPAWRKAGVGTRLLRATVRKLRAEGQPRLNLTVKDTNRSAQKFYEGLGFRRVRTVRRYYEDGRDGILMTLSL
jgi:ribosomal-protein-alanine N-acetyltransferase